MEYFSKFCHFDNTFYSFEKIGNMIIDIDIELINDNYIHCLNSYVGKI